MLRLSLLVLASAITVIPYVHAQNAYSASKPAIASGLEQGNKTADELIEFTELEYQLIQASGLLSLSQQIKYSAQRLIAGSIERPAGTSVSDATTDGITINHAQHFAIAKQLAKRWAEDQWQQRLLTLIHDMPITTQKMILQQLNHPLVKAAQRKERAAISVQSDPAYRLYMNKLRQRPPAASRWQLVENLDQQSGFSEIIIKARTAVIKEMQQQVKGWQPEDLWQKQARQDVLEFLFYAYRKTPNGELKNIADSFNKVELNQFYKDVLKKIH